MRLDAYFRNEIAAGAIASILSLPVCVAAGVLAFSPLGPAYAALGATAGLLGAIAAGGISALAATSSFVVTIPRVSETIELPIRRSRNNLDILSFYVSEFAQALIEWRIKRTCRRTGLEPAEPRDFLELLPLGRNAWPQRCSAPRSQLGL